jgi:tetratricopeptide (TPR) repeat protein
MMRASPKRTNKAQSNIQRRTPKRRKIEKSERGPASQAVHLKRSRSLISIYCLALATMTLAVYLPAVFHPFVNFDDYDYVTQNPHVQSGLSAETISWAFTSTEASNWHPLTWLSHALDCQLFGLNPHGHHLTSVLLHTCNVVLLFLILQWATGALGMSAMVAALFALHPFNVESVAWVAERKNVLSTFFFFLALAAYGRYARRPGLGRYLLVALAFAMGLASKPMLVTLPFVLLLLDYWPLARIQSWTEPQHNPQASWPRLLMEKLPLLCLSVASSIITMIAQRDAVSQFVTFRMRIENAIYSYSWYVMKIFWPVHLAAIYPHPLNKLSRLGLAASALFLSAVSLLVWQRRKKLPFAIVGWLWFVGTLVPVIGVVQVGDQGMADRYMYIPAVGIFVILVWSSAEWSKSQAWLSASARSIGLKVFASLVLLALGLLTIHQIHYWRDPMNLWEHALEVTKDNFVAEDHLAGLLVEQGRINEANRFFESAARVAPLDPISHTGLAAAAQDRGDLQEAIRNYNIALNAKNRGLLAMTYANLAVVYRQLGDYSTAQQNSELALSHNHETVEVMIQESLEALQSVPEASGYVRLGFLLEGVGRMDYAKSAFEKALQLNPTFAPAHKALQELPKAR